MFTLQAPSVFRAKFDTSQPGPCCLHRSALPSDSMTDAIYLLFHLLTTLAKLIGPGGSRTVIAENLLMI